VRTLKASPSYRPLVEACNEHGISRTTAFELAASGVLETFKIGAKRYVFTQSLESLPDRLKSGDPESGGSA